MEISKEIAQELFGMLKSTKEFVLEQAPDVAQQIVAYEIAYRTFSAIMWIGMLITLIVLTTKWRRWAATDDCPSYEKGGHQVASGILAGLGVTTCLILMSLAGVVPLLKATFAPKVFLLEYLAGLIK